MKIIIVAILISVLIKHSISLLIVTTSHSTLWYNSTHHIGCYTYFITTHSLIWSTTFIVMTTLVYSIAVILIVIVICFVLSTTINCYYYFGDCWLMMQINITIAISIGWWFVRIGCLRCWVVGIMQLVGCVVMSICC